jgi:hypothetical protein
VRVLCAAAALLLAQPALAALDVAQYRERLAQIEQLLDQGERAAAARVARALLREEVRWQGEALRADATVLEPIAEGEQEGLRAPLRALIEALPQKAAEERAPAVDLRALEALRARQQEQAPAKGGSLGPELKKLSAAELVMEWLKTSARWIGDRIEELWKWLKKWWPEAKGHGGGKGTAGLNALVFVLVGAIVATVIALALRAARDGAPAERQRPSSPAADADADPLARSTDEWEQRARALAAEGRAREAIRAWYHALLTSSFRAGLLHHRRGRTNWEYARALAAEVPFRGAFAELTGRFDLEWYGHVESEPQALQAFAAQAQRILADLRARAA